MNDTLQGKTKRDRWDVVVVGAGFSGLYLAHRATQSGFSVLIVESAPDVGGTWYWNTYPGARCDVASVDYSFSFDEELQQDWIWSERHATQPEILAYINHVADRYDLRKHILFNTRVTAAEYGSDGWTLSTESGQDIRAKHCVMASGGLSVPRKPDFDGLDSFSGSWYHTARWPRAGFDATGRRIAVIGTGSSGIQVIPELAKDADKLYVLQRTPNFTVPARNRQLEDDELQEVLTSYPERREAARWSATGTYAANPAPPGKDLGDAERKQILEEGWHRGGAPSMLRAFSDVLSDDEVNETVADFVRQKIANTVEDPRTAEALTPRGTPFGAKRLCVDTDYYETFNRPNVELVDLNERPLDLIAEDGIICGGDLLDVDVIVFAIGFDAISGALTDIDITGREGRSLRDYWSGGSKAALGMQIAGFPNMFVVNGPGSPAVLGNVVAFAEQSVEWITDCLTYLRDNGIDTIESSDAFDEAWADHVDEVAESTLYVRAKSWYTGENVPGKPRRFLPYAGGLNTFREKCDAVAASGYEGFVLDGDRIPANSAVG